MDDGGSPIWLGLIIYVCLVLADAMLYGFGAAVQSVNDSQLEEKEREGESKKAGWIRAYKEKPENLVNTIQIVSNLLCLLVGSVVVWGLSENWYIGFRNLEYLAGIPNLVLHILAEVLALLLVLLFLFAFGIQIPKLVGKQYAKKWCFAFVGPVHVIEVVFAPVTKLIVGIVRLVTLLFGLNPESYQDDVTEEEIISMVNEGHEQGVLEATEAEMISNIFEFDDKDAGDIMTHRKNIVAVDGMMQLSQVLDFMLGDTHSRFPVFEEDVDNITGILHLKDAMRYHTKGAYDDWRIKDIPDLIRPAAFIPETRKINLLFQSMQSKKLQMVIVADEYGQTAGLVALEDILEEIVGNIQDEYDEEEPLIEKLNETTYLMDGMAPLEEVEDALGREFQIEDDIETLNGYLIAKLEKIPDEDEHSVIRSDGYEFQIMAVAKKTIQKVRVIKLQEEEAAEEAKDA